MNIRNVLRIYTLERQLNADDIALLNTLRAMNDSEREALVETLSPQPVRKSTKKSASKKSPRASSLEQQIQKRGRRATSDTWENGNDEFCDFIHGDGNGHVCGLLADHNVHHLESYVDYHPFSPAASPASDQSSANGGASDDYDDATRTAGAGIQSAGMGPLP